MTNKAISGKRIELKLLKDWDNYETFGNLQSIKGVENISELFNYELTLMTNNKNIVKEVFCNKSVSFKIEAYINKELKSEKIFNGVIADVSFNKLFHTQADTNVEYEYSITVKPKLYSLDKVKHSTVYYQDKQTIDSVIEKVLKSHGIDYEINIKNPKILIAESCIQYNETDLHFLMRILQSAGLFFFFKHTESKHIMIISDQITSYFDLKDRDIALFKKEDTFLELHTIRFNYSSYISNFSVNAFSYPKPKELVEKKYSNNAHNNQDKQSLGSEEATYLKEITDTNQISHIAESIGTSTQSLCEQTQGKSSYPSFSVGGKFNLTGDFFESLDQKEYLIISLTFEALGYNSGNNYSNYFQAIPKNKRYIPQKIIHKPIVLGLHYALVVDREGKSDAPEPYCDEKGCVYIKLLWGNNVNICKANILSASNSFALPRVGALAYVLFPHSDLYNDIPVIVGIHNKGLMDFKDKNEWYKNKYMAYPESSDKQIYNFITFKDKKDEQEINVQATKDIIYNIENNETVLIKKDSKKIIKEGDLLIKAEKGKIIIESKGSIQVETKADLNMKAKGKIILEAAGIELKSSADITLAASQNISNKASMSATYQAGTSMDIKGNAQLSVSSPMTKIEGKANVSVSSPLTKIGM